MAVNAVPDVDRLPWLADEAVPRKTMFRWWMLSAVLALGAVVYGMSYWFGVKTTQFATPVETAVNQVSAPLPAPSVDPAPLPDVQPAPLPAPVVVRQQQEVRIAIPRSERRTTVRKRTEEAPAKAAPKVAEVRKPLSFSNPWESAGVSGRMVRVGTYASLKQGKQAWSRLAKVYPAMKKLPAVVTDLPSARNGRVYYRLQIGTTSQAHSEVLCQRMKAIGQSCVVVDVAGARRGIGDERQPVGI